MEAIREGTVLAGKYRVDRVLGAGGMGMVVAATHVQLDQRVALKFMLPEALAHGEAAARFLREARAAVKLRSEHVAKVLDVGTLETGAPYIVMEYLEGRDLAAVLQSRGRLPVEEAAEYVLHACDALAEAHAAGIVHRDIKPANLFVARRPDGAPLVKVLDFGISKASTLGDSNPNALTKTASMLGTPIYMSPEQMKSARDVDARSDVWSLDVVLYEALGGRVPFDAETVGALMAKVLVETPAPLHALRPDLPESIAALVASCLEKEPARRCAHVGEIADRLAPYGPPRARPIAERVSGILQVPRASLSGVAGATTASVPGVAGTRAAGPTGMATASSWADGRASLPRARVGARVVAALAAVAVAGAIAVALIVGLRGKPASNGASLSVAASAQSSAAAPIAAPPPLPAAPPPLPAAPPPLPVDPAPPLSATASASSIVSVATVASAHPPPSRVLPPAHFRAAPPAVAPSAKPAQETPPTKLAPEAPPPTANAKPGTAGHKDDL